MIQCGVDRPFDTFLSKISKNLGKWGQGKIHMIFIISLFIMI